MKAAKRERLLVAATKGDKVKMSMASDSRFPPCYLAVGEKKGQKATMKEAGERLIKLS